MRVKVKKDNRIYKLALKIEASVNRWDSGVSQEKGNGLLIIGQTACIICISNFIYFTLTFKLNQVNQFTNSVLSEEILT